MNIESNVKTIKYVGRRNTRGKKVSNRSTRLSKPNELPLLYTVSITPSYTNIAFSGDNL